ncbi:MAG TPA: hypothetical protein VMW10_01645 [Alphaproteobacteria bacterium]|nr:hypothetical protein [Alphaproteobacteria bacterium]
MKRFKEYPKDDDLRDWNYLHELEREIFWAYVDLIGFPTRSEKASHAIEKAYNQLKHALRNIQTARRSI